MEHGKHRILVVGAGSAGTRHVRCFLSTGRAVVSVVEIHEGRRQTLTDQYPVERAYGGVEEALADTHDAVVIATPARLHVPIATRFAAARVHLLIEKPLSVSLAGVQELREAVARHRVVAAVGYCWRGHPVVAALREELGRGACGRPLEIVVVSGQPFALYRPVYRETYYRDRASGGGAIQDALTHMLNAGEWLVGPVSRVVGDCEHLALAGVEVEDTVHVLTRHDDVMGCYALNQHQAPNEATFTVVCQEGTLRGESHRSRVRWMTGPEQPWQTKQLPEADFDVAFVAQAHAFLDAVEGKSPPLCTLDEGIHTLKVNLAVLESCGRTSAWVAVQ